MIRVDFRRRDGLARTGVLTSDNEKILLPAAVEPGTIFPSLNHRPLTNVPLAAPAKFVAAYITTRGSSRSTSIRSLKTRHRAATA
ncbi:MAG: hypothetical protein WC391_06155 [Methanoregula sp.]